MTWWTATSVAIDNGQSIVNVTTGDDVQIAQEAGGLIIGNNPPVEIKRTFLDGTGAKKIELRLPWPYSNVTTQSAVAFPTDADLAEATRVLRAVGSDAVTFAEALAQVIGSTANTITVSTETSGDLSVVPYGKLTQQVQDLLNVIGDFGTPLLSSTSLNDARNKLGLSPRITAQPTLDLDFTKGNFKVYEQYGLTKKTISQAITTTRGSIATYNSPFGIATAAVNEPRIEYDPVTGECLGLLCEEQRTNLLLWSEDFSNAAWNKNLITVQNESDGFYKLIAETTSTGHFIRQSSQDSVVAGTTYTLWVDVKAAEYNVVNLQMGDVGFTANQAASFRLSDQNINTWFFGTNNMSASIKNLGNGVFRCILTGTASVTVSGASIFWVRLSDNHSVIHPSFAGDGTSGILIRRAQLEVGSFPTSYIKTEGSQVTRSADIISGTLNNQINRLNFTYITDLDVSDLKPSASIFRIFGGEVRYNSGTNGIISANGFSAATLFSTQLIGRMRLGVVCSNGSCVFFRNGVKSPAISVTLTPANFNFDFSGSTVLPIRNILKTTQFIPRALSDEEILDLTKL